MDYWRNNRALKHIVPPGETFPEVGLGELLQRVCRGRVFEFGCGYGRLAQFFEPSAYYGYDINPAALTEAYRRNRRHSFGMEWEAADTFLAHTVLLHIPDDDLRELATKIKKYDRIVIGEIMGRKWRRPGDPPVFNRESAEYEKLLGRKATQYKVPYPRYQTSLTVLVL